MASPGINLRPRFASTCGVYRPQCGWPPPASERRAALGKICIAVPAGGDHASFSTSMKVLRHGDVKAMARVIPGCGNAGIAQPAALGERVAALKARLAALVNWLTGIGADRCLAGEHLWFKPGVLFDRMSTGITLIPRRAMGPAVARVAICPPDACGPSSLTNSRRSPTTSHRLPAARSVALCLGLAAVALTGCTHLGPKTVAVDRFDYSTAIANSWKQQTLLNIVKIRYVDLPVFVDVASIVAGFSLETGITVGGSLPETTALGGNTTTLGGAARFTDRPTITYVPMTGEKFLRGLITPIDPKNIFFMLQAGYAADFILGLSVDSLNGVRNRTTAGGTVREADPEFVRVLELLRQVQAAGAFGMQVEEDKLKGSTAVVFFKQDNATPEIAAGGAEIRQLLQLAPEGQKFALTYSPMRGTSDQLTVSSRSMLQIMQAFASYVDVPVAHLEDHSAWPAPAPPMREATQAASVRVHSGKDRPAGAFASVPYRDHWFWIEEGDLASKRALTVIMFLFTLAETGDSGRLPLITIPAQ